MCGEVAVLTLTEFALADKIRRDHPFTESILSGRNALPMMYGPLRDRSMVQIAARLDTLLHKQIRPRWVRDSPAATRFCDDYIPMLEGDRRAIDHNWRLMREAHWLPWGAPNARYNPNVDGLELTIWMIEDFYHLMATDPGVDEALMEFNRERRSHITLPTGWNEPPKG